MPLNDSLDCVWESYKFSVDCFKIASKSIKNDNPLLVQKTLFYRLRLEESDSIIQSCRTELDNLFIVSFWAVFERTILEFITKKSEILSSEPPIELSTKYFEYLKKQIEYWKMDDILDILKGIVDPNLIGQAKQVYVYRNWVAHQNQNRYPSANTAPDNAYNILRAILLEVEKHL